MVPFELGQLKTAQTKTTTADTCSISTHQTQIARMVRRKQYSLRRFDWSNASSFDAQEQSRRTRLNNRRRSVYVVGVFSIDVDDGITTVVIRTARANASPVTSSRDRHCTAVRNATRAATGIAKIRLAKAIHIPRRRSTYVRTEHQWHFWLYEERHRRLHHCRRSICLFFRGKRVYGTVPGFRTRLEYVCNSV